MPGLFLCPRWAGIRKGEGEMPEAETVAVEETPAETGADTTAATPTEEVNEGDAKGGKTAVLADLARERDARQAADTARKAAEAKVDAAKRQIDELAAKVKEFEDRDKTEAQRQADAIDDLKNQLAARNADLAKAELASLKATVAGEKGVPASQLTGETREALEASADELIAWRDASAKPRKPVPTGAPGLKSGATAPADHAVDGKERAAQMLREFRRGGN